MAVKIGSYKGSPVLTLNSESKWPFSFGPAKARLIVANIDAIKAFAAANAERSNGNGHAPNIDEYADQQAAYASRNGGAL